jgi:hypothetical protein
VTSCIYLPRSNRSVHRNSKPHSSEEFPLKTNITRRRTINKEAQKQAEREQSRLFPPMVSTASISGHCGELVDIVLHSIAPEALPGQISRISDREIEECIEVSAIALCWHLAAMADPIRRDRFMHELPNETLGLAVCVEAAGIAAQKGITLHEALQEISDSIGLSQAEERADWNQQPAEGIAPGNRQHQTDRTTGNGAHEGCSRPGRLPPLILPSWTLRSCRELVVRLIRGIDPEAVPADVTAISDEEIEERARACHLVLCWLLGALSMRNSTRRHQLEGRWLKEIPDLVALTIAVGNAENGETTVMKALKELREERTVFDVKIGGTTCVWWQDADGHTQMSGPKDAEEVMKGMARANNFLLAASNAIGVNVNTLSADVLDQLLSEHHLELAQLVADGSSFDVSRAEYKAFVKRFGNLSDREFVAQLVFPCVEAAHYTLDEKARGVRRSFLIRAHMMKAKIEERERRKIVLN